MKMSEFVSEIRSRSLLTSKSSTAKHDFVAEVRSKTYSNREERADNSKVRPKSYSNREERADNSKVRPKTYSNREERADNSSCITDDSDVYLQTILLDKQLSTEAINRLLQGSITTLIEKILTGRTIFSIEGSICVTLSDNQYPIIVSLRKMFSKSPEAGCPTKFPKTGCLTKSPEAGCLAKFPEAGCLTKEIVDSSLNVKLKKTGSVCVRQLNDQADNACSPCSQWSTDASLRPTADSSCSPCSQWSTDASLRHTADNACSPCSQWSADGSLSPTKSDTCQNVLWFDFTRDSTIETPAHESQLSSPIHLCSSLHESSPPHGSYTSSPPHGSYTSSPKSERDFSSPITGSIIPSPSSDFKSIECSPRATTPAETDILGCEIDQSNIFKSYAGSDCRDLEGACDVAMAESVCCKADSLDKMDALESSAISLPNSENRLDRDLCIPTDDVANNIADDGDDDMESVHNLVIDENCTEDAEQTNGTQVGCSKVKDNAHNNQVEQERQESYSPGASSKFTTTCLKKDTDDESISEQITDEQREQDTEIMDDSSSKHLPGNSKVTSNILLQIVGQQSLVKEHQKMFECKYCNDILTDPISLSIHIESVHDLISCTYCSQTFRSKSDLNRHLLQHSEHRPYHVSVAQQHDRERNMMSHHHNKPFRPSICLKGYSGRAGVENHMSKEHKSQLFHVCNPGEEHFNGGQASKNHSHATPTVFTCSTCTFTGCNKLILLKHSLIHSNKIFSCKPCNVYFSDPFHYTSHARKHRDDAAFDQYICCFCLLVHATFEQYIRHEYSHAQEHIHECNMDIKKLSNTSALEDHRVAHMKSHLDTPLRLADDLDISAAHSKNRPSTCDKENYFITSTNVFLLDTSDISSERLTENERRESETTNLEENNDQYSGQLLDLSMKKYHDLPLDNQRSNGFTREPITMNSSTAVNSSSAVTSSSAVNSKVGAADRALMNFLRNDEVNAKSASLIEEYKVTDQRSASGQSQNIKCAGAVNATEGEMNDSVRMQLVNRNSRCDILSSATAESDNQTQTTKLVNSTRLEGHPAQRVKLRLLSNSLRQRQSMRLSPYSRQKMVDLATKFIVARGADLTSNRNPLKANGPTGNEQAAIFMRDKEISLMTESSLASHLQAISSEVSGRKERGSITVETSKDNVEVGSDNTNSGTTLRCHIPTVVKSETLNVRADVSGSPLDCRFPKCKSDMDNAKVGVGNIRGYSCKICDELFETFMELENHSVDIHKRYLCEHCRKSFTARPNRDRHVRYHTGERPYKCDLCEQDFYRGDDLKYHRTTRHPTAQPFVCTRCSANFTWGRDLDRHIRHSKCAV